MSPAYAGMIRSARRCTTKLARVPRLRGDDPDEIRNFGRENACSPPTRG